MASEIRVNKIENRSGLGTVTFSDTGVDLAGIVTATTFSGSGASLTGLPAAQLSGTLPAISAANLTNVPAANITGTLPAISAANLTNVPAANITGTLPAISAASLTNIPAANIVGVCTSGLTKTGGFGIGGKILQVVQVTKSSVQTITYHATNYTEVTDFNPTITPSAATSKIMIMCQLFIGAYGTNVVRLKRDIGGGGYSELAISKGDNTGYSNTTDHYASTEINGTYLGGFILDEPNTTSAVSYKCDVATRYHSSYKGGMNTRAYGPDNALYTNFQRSYFTLLEIGA